MKAMENSIVKYLQFRHGRLEPVSSWQESCWKGPKCGVVRTPAAHWRFPTTRQGTRKTLLAHEPCVSVLWSTRT
jgi:hypothetical protein